MSLRTIVRAFMGVFAYRYKPDPRPCHTLGLRETSEQERETTVAKRFRDAMQIELDILRAELTYALLQRPAPPRRRRDDWT